MLIDTCEILSVFYKESHKITARLHTSYHKVPICKNQFDEDTSSSIFPLAHSLLLPFFSEQANTYNNINGVVTTISIGYKCPGNQGEEIK